MHDWQEGDAATLLSAVTAEWFDEQTQTTTVVGHPEGTQGMIVHIHPGGTHCEWLADAEERGPYTVALSDLEPA